MTMNSSRTLAPVTRTLALMVVAAVAAGCPSVPHISDYKPKRRDYKPPVKFDDEESQSANGSLFDPRLQGAYMFADQRAMRVGDIVTIRVAERADARRGASTALSRDGSINIGINAFFQLLQTFGQNLNPEFLNASQSHGFKGEGTTTRTEDLQATVPAVVRKRFPNGNLFIEGHRVILVNDEEHHFYVSGMIRPVDIAGDNSVPSYLIADAEIEFVGRGVISEKQRQGWLSRALDLGALF